MQGSARCQRDMVHWQEQLQRHNLHYPWSSLSLVVGPGTATPLARGKYYTAVVEGSNCFSADTTCASISGSFRGIFTVTSKDFVPLGI